MINEENYIQEDEKYYLRIEEGGISFLIEGVHQIGEKDIKINKKDYDMFFKLQKDKEYRAKNNSSGDGLFDYIEEYLSEVIVDTTPTTEDRIKALEMVMLEVL